MRLRVCSLVLPLVAAGIAVGAPPTDRELSELTLHALARENYWGGPLLGIEGETTLEATAYGLPGGQRFAVALPVPRAVVLLAYDTSGGLRITQVVAYRFQGKTIDAGIGGTGVNIFDVDVDAAVWTRRFTIQTPASLDAYYVAAIPADSDPMPVYLAAKEEIRTWITGECGYDSRIPSYASDNPMVYVLLTTTCSESREQRLVAPFVRTSTGWALRMYPKSIYSGTSDFRWAAKRFEQHPSTLFRAED